MERGLVSIIVPVFNTAEYVEECILSILSQSYQSVELVLVNDGSTDDSGDICMRYADRSDVHYVAQENLGVTAARMSGIEVSKGEWLMFVDSDDTLPHNAVELLASKTEGVDIVAGSNQFNAVINEPDFVERDAHLVRMYQRRFTCLLTAKLYRRTLFDQGTICIPRQFVWEEDYLMNLRLAVLNTKPVRICHTPVYVRRIDNMNSACHTFGFPLDYFIPFTHFAEGLVKEALTDKEIVRGGAIMRMHYWVVLLKHHHYSIDRHHPYILETIKYLKDADLYRMSQRLILIHPSKITYALSRILVRIEEPRLLSNSIFSRIKSVCIRP